LKFRPELVDREIAFTDGCELAEKRDLLRAELRDVGSKFLPAKLLEYGGPDALKSIRVE
jgi:hypothetical protein